MQDCIYEVKVRLHEDSQVELDLTLTCSKQNDLGQSETLFLDVGN